MQKGCAIVLLLTASLCGCAFSGSAALRRFEPTPAQAPSEALDIVLQATLRDLVVAKGHRLSRLRKQPYVVVMADSGYITPAILPTMSSLKFLILTREQVSQIAGWSGDFIYARLELRALSQSDATVLFEVVETSFDCCTAARRDSVLANLQLTDERWEVRQVSAFTNPAYFQKRLARLGQPRVSTLYVAAKRIGIGPPAKAPTEPSGSQNRRETTSDVSL